MFGATGDLARRMLLPSLYGLDSDGLLPDDLRIIGTARTELDDAGFRGTRRRSAEGAFARRFLQRRGRGALSVAAALRSARHQRSRRASSGLPTEIGDPCHGVAIFLSTAPSLFKPTIDGLEAAGLACPTVRMALEKPLGSDLEFEPRDQRRRRCGFPRGPHLPDRPLSRQGDGPEPARAALREFDVRAVVEQRAYRPCPDHGRGDDRARRAAAIITTRRARSATWSRTTCSSCSRWSRWSRRPTSTRPRCATRR